MPLYEYQCDTCGHRFEAIQKFSDAPLDTCPKCGAGVRKLQSAPAIQFKGAGWYITDYAKKDSVSAGKSSESSSGTDGPATAAKSGSDAAASTSKESGGAAPAAPATGTKSST
jgi:putative FmdB family regulatory protein